MKAFLPVFVLSALVSYASVSETITQTHPLNANGAIYLDNVNGSVEITGWDKNEVSLVAEKRGRKEEVLKLIKVDIDATPDALRIKTHLPKSSFFENSQAEVRFKLFVPVQANVKKVDVVNASVQIKGVHGDVSVESVNGSIVIEDLHSSSKCSTVNGQITLKAEALPSSAEIDLETVNGSIKLHLPKNCGASLDAETVNGSISCDFPLKESKTDRGSLKGKIGDGSAELKLETVNGSIHVRQL